MSDLQLKDMPNNKYTTKEQAIKAIARLGEIQRELEILQIAKDEEIAKIAEKYQASDLKNEYILITQGVKEYCETNRAELTENGKLKTVKFATGEVKWRAKPASVTIEDKETVLDLLIGMDKTEFINIKYEINKQAILANPKGVIGIDNITINKGQEEFTVKPLTVKAD